MKPEIDVPLTRMRDTRPGVQGVDLIRVGRPFHVWLHFDVLSHVWACHGRCSAHERARPWRPWVAPLSAAIGRDIDRRVERLPFEAADYSMMYPAAGDDELGRALRDAWTLEYHRVSTEWQADGGYGRRLERFWQHAAEPIERCRRALWPTDPRPLHVLDVPPLGRHVRSADVGPDRVVALDLHPSPEELICRVVQDEARSRITEGVVARYAALEGGLAGGGDAGPLQMSLDAAAARRAEQVLEIEAPDVLGVFRRMQSAGPGHPPGACD